MMESFWESGRKVRLKEGRCYQIREGELTGEYPWRTNLKGFFIEVLRKNKARQRQAPFDTISLFLSQD